SGSDRSRGGAASRRRIAAPLPRGLAAVRGGGDELPGNCGGDFRAHRHGDVAHLACPARGQADAVKPNQEGKSMSPDTWETKIDAYVDSELPPEQMEAMHSHLRGCPACTAQMA